MSTLENADAGGLQAEPQPSPNGNDPVEKRARGRLEWLWRGRALQDARARVTETPALEARRLQRARRALELADRAFDPVDPLRSGSSVGLALSLYREAAYWTLLSLDQAASAASLPEAFEQADRELLRAAVGNNEDAFVRLRKALLEKDFVASAEDSEDVQRADAELARDFVHALVDHKLEPEARVGRVLVQRWSRVGLLGAVSVALLVGGLLAFTQLGRGPDLAAGKSWQASSQFPGCNFRDQVCNGTHVKVFFHTEEEDQPWVRFDLGRRTKFAHVELVNRSDIGSDRGYPIVIETSDDGEKWREVSRRELPYSKWMATFAPVRARYVRARLLKRSYFHLEGFRVYAP
jgi:hypothetical protein